MKAHTPSPSNCGAIVPPQAVEFEKAILGTILSEPSQLLTATEIVQPADFYDPRNRLIYLAMLSLSDHNNPIDLLAVAKKLKTENQLASIGGQAYLVELTASVGSGSHTAQHALQVKETAIARQLLEASRQTIGDVSEGGDVLDTVTQAAQRIDAVVDALHNTGRRSQEVRQVVGLSLRQLEERCAAQAKGVPVGITSGLGALDGLLSGGFKAGQLVVLAARPAMGKTALMLHFAKSAAMQRVPVCIYSLEMNDTSLVDRLILSEAQVDTDRYRTGRVEQSEWAEINRASEVIAKLPIYIDDRASVTMRYIRASATALKRKGKCAMVMIDYLQLADTRSDNKGRSRENEVSEATRAAKLLAKELECPVVLLSQLNRAVESRTDKKPQLSDLRESGSIEQDADIVAFIHRPAYYGQQSIQTRSQGEISTEGIGIVSVAKQRDGATGDVVFRHNASMSKIYDFEAVHPVTSIEPF